MHAIRSVARKVFKIQLPFYGIWIVLTLVCLVLSIVTETFFTYSNLTNIARQVSVNIILACGMTIVIIIGGIDLSVGATLAFSSFIMADLMRYIGMIPAMAAGLVIGGLVGLLNGLLVSQRKSMAFVITLGTMTVWRSLTSIYSGGLPISGFSSVFQDIASGSMLFIPILFWIALFTVILCEFVLQYTKYGKYVYAIGSNTIAAKNCGISIRKMIMAAYMICGLLAALAGIVLTSRLDAAQAQGALGYEMDVIAAVVIGGASLSGGRGRVTGTLAGALLMGILRNGLNLMNVSANWQQTVIGVVIVVTILWDKGAAPILNSIDKKGDAS